MLLDTLFALTDEHGAEIGAHVKLKFGLISSPGQAATTPTDTHVSHLTPEHTGIFAAASELAAIGLSLARAAHGTNELYGTCTEPISQALSSMKNIVDRVKDTAEVSIVLPYWLVVA